MLERDLEDCGKTVFRRFTRKKRRVNLLSKDNVISKLMDEKMRKQISRYARIAKNMENIEHKIIIISNKGGVGKTTVAVNLAFSLMLHGNAVGLIDADIHGPNVPKMLGIDDKRVILKKNSLLPVLIPIGRGIKVMSMAFLINKDAPVIWRGPIKMSIIDQFLSDVEWGQLEYLVVDMPPGTGDEPLSIVQRIPNIDGAVIVTTPQEVALLDARKAVTFAKLTNIPVIGIIENMSGMLCPHCGKEIDLFKIGGGERAAKEFDVPFLGRIPMDPRIVVAEDSGKPFVLEHKDSEAAKSFEMVVRKIERAMKHM